jgi:hypothetical protein
MADFSSRNFLSVGTNFGSSPECGGLVEPPCQTTAYGQRSQPFATMTLRGPVSGVVTLYTRAVVDQLTGQVIPNVPLTSRSVWDHLLENANRAPKFTLNRFNYDAMADLLLPRAVGYSAGFLDTFFRGGLGGYSEHGKYKISVSPEPMVGTFELRYERTDGSRPLLTSWVLQVDPEQEPSPLTVPDLPEDAAPGAPCWLVFRGQIGGEPDAVAGSRAGCPFTPPPPPPPGQWYVYVCATQVSQLDYVYATTNPPLWGPNDPALTISYTRESTGTTFSCSLRVQRAVQPPPQAWTEHPL